MIDAFLYGLVEPIKDNLTPLKLPLDIDSLISLAIRIDNRLQERERERPRPVYTVPFQRGQSTTTQNPWRSPAQFNPAAVSPAPPAVSEEPMQLGRTRLTPEERQHRMREGRYIYCAQLGHYISGCPVKDQASARNTLVSHTTVSSVRPLMQAHLITPSQTLIHPVLIDSGADESFIDWRLATKF